MLKGLLLPTIWTNFQCKWNHLGSVIACPPPPFRSPPPPCCYPPILVSPPILKKKSPPHMGGELEFFRWGWFCTMGGECHFGLSPTSIMGGGSDFFKMGGESTKWGGSVKLSCLPPPLWGGSDRPYGLIDARVQSTW